MNNITKKIILGAIATTTIISLPATAKAQQYLDYGYLDRPFQEIQNQEFDSFVSVNEIKNLAPENLV